MKKLLIFGGTYEGRTLCEHISGAGQSAHVCTATPYGAELLAPLPGIIAHCRRMDAAAMADFFREQGFWRIIDATHPYAVEVTANIRAACAQCGLEYLRLLRDAGDTQENGQEGGPEIRTVPDIAAAVEFLAQTEGRVLITTGSRNAAAYRAVPNWRERLFLRVLPTPEVLAQCHDLGFATDRIIAMQGPFSAELNAALLRQFGCSWLVSKDTGRAGGLAEKFDGAAQAGARVLLIARPEESGLALAELLPLLGLNSGPEAGKNTNGNKGAQP